MKRASMALWLVLWGYAIYLLFSWLDAPPKPKELTVLDVTLIMVNANNKTRRELRTLKTELDHVKRQLAGELPQINGGVSYE